MVDRTERADRAHRPRPAGDDARVRRAARRATCGGASGSWWTRRACSRRRSRPTSSSSWRGPTSSAPTWRACTSRSCPESDDHAVRIMTMHGAKGLEFPITVLSGLTTEIGRRRRGVQALWEGDHVHVSMRKNVASEGFDRRADLEEEMDGDEKLRLLYVACTRGARPPPGRGAPQRGGEGGDVRPDALERERRRRPEPCGSRWRNRRTAACRSRPVVPPPPASDDAFAAVRAAEEAWRAERGAVLARAARVHAFSATAVKRAAAAGSEIDADEDRAEEPVGIEVPGADPVPEWRRGKGATDFGKAVHAVLQDVDLATGADAEPLAHAAAAAEGLAGRTAEVAAAVRAILATPVMRTAATAAVFREMYVAAPFGDRVVEGYVDLLVPRAGRPGGGRLQDRSTGHRRRARRPGRVLPTAARGLRRGDRGGHGGAGRVRGAGLRRGAGPDRGGGAGVRAVRARVSRRSRPWSQTCAEARSGPRCPNFGGLRVGS